MRKRNWLKGVGGVTGRSQLAEGGVPGVEQLEARVMLNAAPQDDRYATHTINWNGRAVEVVRDSWVLTFHNEQTRQQVANRTVKVAEFFGLQPERIETTALGMFSSLVVRGQVTEAMAQAAVQHFPWLRLVEPNRVYQHRLAPNDAGYPFQWGHNNTGLEFPDSGTGQPAAGVPGADIDAELAWNITTGTDRVVIAVIDTGVQLTHPDLAANIWTNPLEIPNNGIDDDNNGYIDDVRGWDFVGNDNQPRDSDGHGSHVSGTIAANRGNGGITGVAPEAVIMPLRVFGGLGFSDSGYIRAIDYAIRNGAQVISMSLGGPLAEGERAAIARALAANVVVVAASGNESLAGPLYPAVLANEFDHVLPVGAVDRFYRVPAFSNGATSQPPLRNFVVAPGIDVLSLTRRGNEFERLDGTSMATPHVAGVVALVRQANPNLNAMQVVDLISRSAWSQGLR